MSRSAVHPDSPEAMARYQELRSRPVRRPLGRLAVDTSSIERLGEAALACSRRIDAALARVREAAP